MTDSSRIAGLLGPTLIALSLTEWKNLDVFEAAIGPSFAPHVYLNGTLIFIAGLAIVRAHNSWTWSWSVLITLVGWFAILAGLGRMAAPMSSQEAGRHPNFVYATLVILLVIGIVLTLKAYGRREGRGAPPQGQSAGA